MVKIMKPILITLTSLFLIVSCSEPDTEEDIPGCIDMKIREFKSNIICNQSDVKKIYLSESNSVCI